MDITTYFRDKQMINVPSIEYRFDEYRHTRTEPFNDEVVYEALSKHLAYLNNDILELRKRINASLERMKKLEMPA